MSLFKVLRGNSANLSSVEFHDGYAYFTPDDGGFYIDSEVGDTQKRTQINPKSESLALTLLASGWSGGAQTLQASGVTASSNGVLGLSMSATSAEREAAKSANLYISAQGSGTITVSCGGTVPSINIPLTLVVVQ